MKILLLREDLGLIKMRQQQQCVIGWMRIKCVICHKRLWEAWKVKRYGNINWEYRCYKHLET